MNMKKNTKNTYKPDDPPTAQNGQRMTVRLSLRQGFRAMRNDRAFLWLLILFIALNLADLVATLVGLRLGGFDANPLFNPIFRRSAVTASLLKIAGTLLLTSILLTTFSTMPRLTRWVAIALCLILAVFVANNIWTVVRLLAR
jgi:CDP-diglyceride synthetase